MQQQTLLDSFGRSIAVKYDENTIFTPLRKNAHLIILINSTAILKAADEVFLINKAVRVSPKKLIKKNINIPLDIVNMKYDELEIVSGSIYKTYFKFTFPNMIGLIAMSSVSLVDD